MDKKEFGTTSSLNGIDTTRSRTIWIFFALVIMSIAILLVIRFNQKQKQDNTKKDSELKSIKEILYSYAPLSLPPGQLEWKIKGVEQKIENQEDIYSDPFYVGLYKCQGKIQWNRWNENTVYVSIFIMKGAYDYKLHWPIRYKCTLILLNRINSNNNYKHNLKVTKEYLKKYPSSFERPTELRNDSDMGILFI
ncbi:hypothetical protein LOD99_10207 [Oopsacas minuta]|uniref:MATH domain-containing protein n=1 Tax=Oopsacas minuta TaxID=111878 RepID=A0AAV7KIS4_9METZ|nr:hypothetical protein LOD99_10207 [Oopsacas minuta]